MDDSEFKDAQAFAPSDRMVEAGLDALRRSGVIEIPLDSDSLVVAEIYRAMAIVQAGESCSPAC